MINNRMEVHEQRTEPWRITLIDTGDQTQTGGHLKRIASYLDSEDFCMSYGDGFGDIDISSLLKQHRLSGQLAAVTAVPLPGRFGRLELTETGVTGFLEKPEGDGDWINGGFFVLSPKVLDYIQGDNTPWGEAPLAQLSIENQLGAYRHRGFWQHMDTLRDKHFLESLWAEGKAPWKQWD